MGTFTQAGTSRARRGAAEDTIKPIFTADNDIVPGQLVVQVTGEAAMAMTGAIAGPRSRMAAASTREFGMSALDKALGKLNVTMVARLHPPAPPSFLGARAAMAEPLADTFRVEYAADTPPEQAVEALAGVDGVEMVEAVRYRETLATTPNDPMFAQQWGLTRVHCPEAWDRTTGSNAITLAVIDTGVDLDHPELQPLLVPGRDLVNLGPAPGNPPGFHFEGDFNVVDSDPMDEVGHGTHVAGTIACLSNNGASVAGVTWNCRIMPVRVLARIVSNTNPNDVRGTGSSADIAAGIRWAVDHGARILNLSLGGPTDTQVERDAIAYAIANNVLVCAAMGNDGTTGLSYPAAYPEVVAVGAINSSDQLANFSQRGPHIDVVGPGVNVLSTVWNNTTTTMSGTSMATPHIAGVAALVLSIKPSLTAAQCAEILRSTADPLRKNPADPVPNDDFGWGCVNAFAAVNKAKPVASNTVICQNSVVVVCQQSTAITCQVASQAIWCQPSVVTVCQSSSITCASRAIVCQTRPITCRSQFVICNSQRISCQPTRSLVCQVTRPVQCVASGTVTCPSGVICGPGSIACNPQSLACGPGGPGGPIGGPIGGLSETGREDDDPYAPDYGYDE